MRRALRAHLSLTLCVTLLLVAAPVAGFSSLPPGASPHDEVTREAANSVGYPDRGTPGLREAVRAPDLKEVEWKPEGGGFSAIGLRPEYRSSHHCDRLLPDEDAESLEATLIYIDEQRAAADQHMQAGDAEAAVEALGAALHAAQDCFSHSNVAELGPPAVERLRMAITADGSVPEGVRLVAVARGASPPGAPDDPYDHDGHSKDAPDQNEVARSTSPGFTQSHYDLAHEGARLVTQDILQTFLAHLDDDQRAALADVDASKSQAWFAVLNLELVVALVLVAIGAAGAVVAIIAYVRIRRADA